jgi:hypothetical protein
MTTDQGSERLALLSQQVEQLREQGLFQEAVEIAIEARDLCHQLLGEQHHAYAVSLDNLAAIYRSRGDHAAAEPLLRRGLEIRHATLNDRARIYDTRVGG